MENIYNLRLGVFKKQCSLKTKSKNFPKVNNVITNIAMLFEGNIYVNR